MRQRTFIYALVSWLCLLSFGLDLAVHAIRPFACSSVELAGLDESSNGEHRRSVLGLAVQESMLAGPRHDSEPCDHPPSSEEHDQSHHLSTRPDPANQGVSAPPVVVAVLPPTDWKLPVEIGRSRVEQRVRPPDAVHRLRTVVIII